MKWFIFLTLLTLTSCVPRALYEELERRTKATEKSLEQIQYDLIQCQKSNQELKKEIDRKPKTVNVPVMVPARTIDPAELDEIKRQAFEEAEKKFRTRVEQQKRKGSK